MKHEGYEGSLVIHRYARGRSINGEPFIPFIWSVVALGFMALAIPNYG